MKMYMHSYMQRHITLSSRSYDHSQENVIITFVHAEMVSCLLDNGTNVNDPGGDHCGGVSPLIDAASSGHMDIVQLLVQRGADIFHKDAQVCACTYMYTKWWCP